MNSRLPPGVEPYRSPALRWPLRLSLELLLPAVLALCILRMWIMPLPSSLWVDEMATVYVVGHGAADPSLQVAPQVAASVYYLLPALAMRIAGRSEIAIRFFSVLAMAGALFGIWRIARRLIHPDAGWLAIFGCLAMRNFNYQASDARPYALGSCVVALAILFLVRWLDSGRWSFATGFAAAAILLWWVHLLFWPFYIVFACYAGARIWTRDSAVRPLQFLVALGAIFLGCLPLVLKSLALLPAAAAHVVVPLPAWPNFVSAIQLLTITGPATAAFLAARHFQWDSSKVTVSTPSLVLILSWWLVPPVALYVTSLTTGNSVFLSRYLYLAVPGVVLTTVLLLALALPAERLRAAGLAVGVLALVFGGHWNQLWPRHTGSDWKRAAVVLRQWVGSGDIPVLCPSPFVEAQPPVWKADSPASGFLYSNLAFYPTPGHAYAFPFIPSPEAETYAASLSAQVLSPATRFAIYGGDTNVRFWRAWFAARPEFQNWNSRLLGSFGDVLIVVFDAAPTSSPKPRSIAPASDPIPAGTSR